MNDPKNIVCLFNTSKKLHEVGYKYNTVFVWIEYEENILQYDRKTVATMRKNSCNYFQVLIFRSELDKFIVDKQRGLFGEKILGIYSAPTSSEIELQKYTITKVTKYNSEFGEKVSDVSFECEVSNIGYISTSEVEAKADMYISIKKKETKHG